MTKDTLPPLTAEAFDRMMEDVSKARSCLSSLELDAGHDRHLAAELSLEILKCQKRLISSTPSGTSNFLVS